MSSLISLLRGDLTRQVRNADALLSAMADALTHLEWESSESESIMRRFASRALADLEGDFEENTLKWASVHSAAMLTPAGWVRDQMEVCKPRFPHLFAKYVLAKV
jgi:hypothetical protein